MDYESAKPPEKDDRIKLDLLSLARITDIACSNASSYVREHGLNNLPKKASEPQMSPRPRSEHPEPHEEQLGDILDSRPPAKPDQPPS